MTDKVSMASLGFSEEALLNLAAQKIADQFWDADNLGCRAEKMLEERVNQAVPKQLNQKIDNLLEEEMRRILSAEIIPCDMWGDRVGPPTTIRDQITVRARSFWEERVDEKGKLSSYGGKPRHEHMMRQIVQEEFDKAIKQNVVNIVGAMKIAAKAHAEKITNEALDNLIKVKV